MAKVNKEKRIAFRVTPDLETELTKLTERYNVKSSEIQRKALELFISTERKYQLIKGETPKRMMNIEEFLNEHIPLQIGRELETELTKLTERYNLNSSEILRKALELFISTESKYQLIKGEAPKRTIDIKEFLDELVIYFSSK